MKIHPFFNHKHFYCPVDYLHSDYTKEVFKVKKGSLVKHKENTYITMTVIGFSSDEMAERSVGKVKSHSDLSDNPELQYVICEYLKPPCDHRMGTFRNSDLILIKE